MVLEFDTIENRGGKSHEEAMSVIANGHPPVADGVILIDFDATIAPFGYLFSYPEPFPGVVRFIQRLKEQGYTIGIFTSRLSPKWLKADNQSERKHRAYIKKYCEQYFIPFDFATSEKVPAIVYIDDKAITFNGDWQEITETFEKRGWLNAE